MYRKSAEGWMKHLDFLILDLICLEFSYLLSYLLRHGFERPYYNPIYRNMVIIFIMIEFLTAFIREPFKNVLKRGYYKEFFVTLEHVCMVMLLAVFYLFLTHKTSEYSRITLVLTGVIFFCLSYIVRVLWKKYLLTRWIGDEGKRSLFIITGKAMAQSVISSIKNNDYLGFRIAGVAIIDGVLSEDMIEGIPILTKRDSIIEYVQRCWVDEVFADFPSTLPIDEEMLKQFIEMGVTVHIKLEKTQKFAGSVQFIEQLGNNTVLTSSIHMATSRQIFTKRFIDICGGLAGCLITGVLFILVAPCIYIKSPGPVFFSQIRVGKNGKKFRIYKFRSMYLDAEARKNELMEQNRIKDGMMFKLENDPRIIGNKHGKGIGHFIREYSIDEWPQFFNVLKGDMSLVGTRPPTVDEWEKYELHHRARLSVKPGLTGLWQISGRSNITDFEEVVKLDKQYIDNWSFGQDMKILIKTIFVVAKREGSK